MGTWAIFSGSGTPIRKKSDEPVWTTLPDPPPWRRTGAQSSKVPEFETPPELVAAVNAALRLRRPLLLTGLPGSGKSTLVDLIAAELELGPVLRWPVTSKTVFNDGLFRYDALGHLQKAESVRGSGKEIGPEAFVTLGPLGAALASTRSPRAVLVDEIDKSDLDLPSDLLNVLEDGSFVIPQLLRESRGEPLTVLGVDQQEYIIRGGLVASTFPPVIVMTSNGERAFPPPFLRRCIRYTMPTPDKEFLGRVVERHLTADVKERESKAITEFAERLKNGDQLAVDQLLNYLHLLDGKPSPTPEARRQLQDLLLQSLSAR